jgi:hypothetical protein
VFFAGLNRPRRRDGVGRVGLAVATPVMTIPTSHLDHLDTRRGQVTGKPRAPGAGPFDADDLELSEALQPSEQ